MQKIYIKKSIEKAGDNEIAKYIVPALPLKNSGNNIKLTIPHPTGTYKMEFDNLEDAVKAIKTAGFEYVLPNGETYIEPLEKKTNKINKKDLPLPLGDMIYQKLLSKINDSNSTIVASALEALSEIDNEKSIDIFLKKLGEDNETIRNVSINALLKSKELVIEKLIDLLTDSNWVTRHSAITCLSKIAEFNDIDKEQILVPIFNRIDDINPIVQTNAIQAVSKIYHNLKTID